MKLEITKSEETGPMQLAGDLDIYCAEDLHEALGTHIAKAPSLELDLSGVVACDAVGLQLLCSARRSATAADKGFRVVAASEPVLESCAALGITAEQLAID